jgi:hydroxymethylpyrimidine/phosphomethylpyrimidine kinase
MRADAVAAYTERLFKQATLVTPNLDEAAALLGRPIRSLPEMHEAARELAARFGASAWLLKGGHLAGAQATDLLVIGGAVTEFSAPFVRGVSTHGTGCTYAAAVTAGLARGLPLEEAVKQAKTFVTRAIASHFRWNAGATHALNHFAAPP